MLEDAAADGLVARDYLATELRRLAASVDGSAAATEAADSFEQALDASMLHYLRDLHLGRVPARALGFRIEPGRASPDFAGLLRAAATTGTLRRAVAELRPRLGQYAKLREALAHYRSLAAETASGPLLARPPAHPVKPGDSFPDAAVLQRRLIALGDLPAGVPPAAGRHDGNLPEGLRQFQARHGLKPDGVLGRDTLKALNVPLATRVQQLELALERLRWLPDLGARPFIGINIPMFRLWAWDPTADTGRPPVDMGVVVGRALDTQTPVLSEEMRYVVFRPFWNVPRSILINELLPAVDRDPAYLQQHEMDIVRGAGDDAETVEASPENLARLREGTLRLRQRPGRLNSLGLMKFIFPNDNNVYLHGTPAPGLFGRARRDFSHGCVRVQDPVALAEWVLKDQAPWTRKRIEAAVAGPATLRVDLAQPLTVILFYMTAMVMPSDGSLHFAPDIYGHDARLLRALAERAGQPLPAAKGAAAADGVFRRRLIAP